MAFQLHISHTGHPGELIVPLPDGDHLIGRSRSAEIQLSQPDVSGKHLILHVDGDSVIAENLSSHGSRTGQTTLELPTPIRVGDSIYLGKSTVITLQLAGEGPDDDAPETATVVADDPAPAAPEPPPAPPKTPAPAADPGATVIEAAPAPAPTPAADPEVTIVGAVPAPAPAPAPAADPDVTIVGAVPAPAPAPAADPDVTIVGEVPAPVPPAPADDMDATVIEAAPAPAPAPRPAPARPAAPPAPAKMDATVAEAAPADGEEEEEDGEDVFKTNVMQTRIASAEELDFLRRQDRNTKRGKKLKYIIPLVVAALALAAVFFFKGEPPEEKLTWPKTADGKFSEKPYDPAAGGFSKGRFSLIAPLVETTQSSVGKDGDLVVITRIGRDRDVELRLTLSCKRSAAYLHESREKTFRDWIREVSASGGHWNFDQISDLFFIGKNNGLPCMSAVYTREVENQSWYGEVIFFRNGDERIVRMAEIPGSERLRGAGFLAGNAFLFTSPQFIENHWEGAEGVFSGDPAELLQEAKGLLVKMSPATWDKITMLLRAVLVQATEKDLPDLREDALNQLRKLRNYQKVWYNAQMIAYLKEKAAGNLRAAELIRDSCLAVFSSKDDLRHRNIQRNIWE